MVAMKWIPIKNFLFEIYVRFKGIIHLKVLNNYFFSGQKPFKCHLCARQFSRSAFSLIHPISGLKFEFTPKTITVDLSLKLILAGLTTSPCTWKDIEATTEELCAITWPMQDNKAMPSLNQSEARVSQSWTSPNQSASRKAKRETSLLWRKL